MSAGRWSRAWSLVVVLAGTVLAEQGGRYLIIAADGMVDAVRPLADWKTRKGMLAKVVPASAAGTDPYQIQTFIRNAYNNWPVPPEYVLVVGNPSLVRSPDNSFDGRYGDMVGDYKMEIPVGRLPAWDRRECSTMVAKTVAYEQAAGVEDSTWYLKGMTCVREDHGADDSIYWNDSRILHGYWTASGYLLAESLSMDRGSSSQHVNAGASDGRTFITYRGQGVGSWWSPFNQVNPGAWNNRGMMPVAVGATCATVTLAPGESMYGDEFVRAGTPDALGGAIAYFGTTLSGVNIARARSNCFRGFFNSLYVGGNQCIGDATLVGRSWTISDRARYEEWNLLGDPELNVWTGAPRTATVVHDSVAILAPQLYRVSVRTGDNPVQRALVCVAMDSAVYAHGLTDALGQVALDINPTHVGTMSVVVTGRNLRPYEGDCAVVPGGVPYVVVAGSRIDEYVGNHDGVLNPGEQVRLWAELANIGGVTALNVDARLRVADPGVVVRDSTSSYGTILPDSSSWGDPFDLCVDSGIREGHVVMAELLISDSQGDTWNRPLDLVVRSGRIAAGSPVFLDSAPGGNGNGRLGRNESGRLSCPLANTGGSGLLGLRATLVALNSNVIVVDSTAYYGRAGAGETLPGWYDRFGITSGPGLASGGTVTFSLDVWADGGTYHYSDTLELELLTEAGGTNGPSGPDRYGYWCYDDTDTASGQAPVYQWLELAPPGPGQVVDSVSDYDAVTVTRLLPFSFRYYGVENNFISMCSNGFLALGYASFTSGYNRPIPDTAGPPSMVAPFWDDLNPDETRNGYGTAYQHFDTSGRRWILEYRNFAHYNQQSIRETFQVILHDPAYRPTPTGDGEIVFLYNRVALGSGCTVGIESQTENDGIQYLYNNVYDENAAYLQSGRAVKFTTHAPRSSTRPWLVPVHFAVSDSASGNNNGLFEAGETLTAVITVRNQGSESATEAAMALESLEPDAVVLDSWAELGTILVGGQASNSAQPFRLRVADLPQDSLLNFELIITAQGYATTGYFSVGLTNVSAVERDPRKKPLKTGLERIRPSLVKGQALVRYGLARPGLVDLALFDAAGRKVATFCSGLQNQGFHALQLYAAGLCQGVYFCRLQVQDDAGVHHSREKIQILR